MFHSNDYNWKNFFIKTSSVLSSSTHVRQFTSRSFVDHYGPNNWCSVASAFLGYFYSTCYYGLIRIHIKMFVGYARQLAIRCIASYACYNFWCRSVSAFTSVRFAREAVNIMWAKWSASWYCTLCTLFHYQYMTFAQCMFLTWRLFDRSHLTQTNDSFCACSWVIISNFDTSFHVCNNDGTRELQRTKFVLYFVRSVFKFFKEYTDE